MPFGGLPLAEDDVINLAWPLGLLYYMGQTTQLLFTFIHRT